MATFHDRIKPEQTTLIQQASIFFVASVTPDLSLSDQGQGPVNLSPKGGTPLHIISDQRVAYLDYFGSGNETARHAASGGPITIMVMAMGAKDAAVVRLFGHATVMPVDQSPLADRLLAQPAESLELAPRQVIDVAVDSTVTSCGYGVPVFSFASQRVRSQRGRKFKEPV